MARDGFEGPVRIGLPHDGWALAVFDRAGEPVAMGESGELVIGGVGLARYLDTDKDAAKFAPLPSLGWERAYRSGDIVRADDDGLMFLGRADEQVKLGGRRITFIPKETVRLADPDKARSMLKLVDMLEDLEDVQNVHANFEIDDKLMEQLA